MGEAMRVAQYTTPVFFLTFDKEGLDLTAAKAVYVTFKSGLEKLTKTGAELVVGEKTITVMLSQEESGRMGRSVEIQANWIMGDRMRCASDVMKYEMGRQILTRVINDE